MTRITLHIETEDAAVIERVGQAIKGTSAPVAPVAPEVKPEPAPTPAPTPQPEPEQKDAATAFTSPEPEPATSEGPELDTDGLPWDDRIHASTKTKKQDGKWKAKRGVNAETVKQVEAELRQVMGIDEPAPENGGYAEPAPQPQPQPEPAPQPDPAPQPQQTAAPSDFMTLVGMIGQHGYQQGDINAALQKCNPPLPSFQQLANRPDLIPAFWENLTGA